MTTPTKPTTPEQWTVLAGATVTLLVLLGIGSLYLASRIPLDEAVRAAEFRRAGYLSFGLAGVVGLARRLWIQFLH